MFSIYDKAIEAYMRPFMAQAEGQATRMFQDIVCDEQSDLFKHPEDYSLFKIGSFDDNNGELLDCEPTCVMRAHEVSRTVVKMGERDAS